MAAVPSAWRGMLQEICATLLVAAILLGWGSATARAVPLVLLDSRGWEMVSPVEKNGGEVQGFGAIAGGGLLQVAANGESATFSSASSFGGGAQGAPVASQYISRRGTGGWSTQDVTLPTTAGAFGEEPDGVPYRLFSGDLARAVVFDGQAYFLRDSAGGGLTVLPGQAPQASFEGASPDLRHLALALEGGLYEYSEGSSTLLSAVPGARLAPQGGAISEDGSRVYFSAEADLWLREGAQTKGVDEAVGGGAQLGAVTPDGAFAFFTKAGSLYRYSAAAGTAAEVGLGGAIEGPLQVSADGSRLAFLSKAPLTGYDNTDQDTGEPDAQVFIYDATANGGAGGLICASCNPGKVRPIGASSIPGAVANGVGSAVPAYKPRALVAGARRLFFDSRDALVSQDTNNDDDVYEWEAQGVGGCKAAAGCLNLISSGRSEDGASFVDASESGRDAFFLTDGSLVPSDPLGTVDLYDAREGGGFPIPAKPIPCEGDACQPLPSPPEDPTPGTQVPTGGNPPVRFPPEACPRGKHRVKRHGKSVCVAKHHRKSHRRKGRK
jgi:hypothetical protein